MVSLYISKKTIGKYSYNGIKNHKILRNKFNERYVNLYTAQYKNIDEGIS